MLLPRCCLLFNLKSCKYVKFRFFSSLIPPAPPLNRKRSCHKGTFSWVPGLPRGNYLHTQSPLLPPPNTHIHLLHTVNSSPFHLLADAELFRVEIILKIIQSNLLTNQENSLFKVSELSGRNKIEFGSPKSVGWRVMGEGRGHSSSCYSFNDCI